MLNKTYENDKDDDDTMTLLDDVEQHQRHVEIRKNKVIHKTPNNRARFNYMSMRMCC
jgi:hypothetical protein